MSNTWKTVFIVLIALLILASGGLGYLYSNLNGKINTLDDDTQAFKTSTANEFDAVKSDISSVDSSLTGFKTDTSNQFTDVRSDITGLDTNLNAFKTDTASKFSTVNTNIAGINVNVAGLDSDFNSLASQYNESTMNVRRVYDDVIGSVCQIVGNLGAGSGFVYDEDGYIVTCWHVVNNQDYIDVILHDGTCKRATIIGSDRASDVAVIKIDGVSNLQPLPLADSDTLVPGEPIIIVGNPFGIFETVVYGVISRTQYIARVGGVGVVANLVQYDAAQNGGNSGGPVFNNKGQVIGIADNSNTAAEGIHYAVSANKVKRVADAIIDTGSFTNCILPGTWLVSDLDPSVVINRGLDNAFGFIFQTAIGVDDVQQNDICIAVDGIVIRDLADFFSYTSLYKSVGDTVTLTLIRGSASSVTHLEVSLTLVSGWLE